ncbi:MAG: hypothetical protein HW394_609, partial [Acidobacteria bacterium]|nr:hypothetical protein [Acidobacteriota bacterium]
MVRHAPLDAQHDRLVLRVAIAASAAMLLWMARPLFTGQVPFTG